MPWLLMLTLRDGLENVSLGPSFVNGQIKAFMLLQQLIPFSLLLLRTSALAGGGGLDRSTAAMLGLGVGIDVLGGLKAGLIGEEAVAGFFWKKLEIDFWLDFCELGAGLAFGVDISFPSMPRTISVFASDRDQNV